MESEGLAQAKIGNQIETSPAQDSQYDWPLVLFSVPDYKLATEVESKAKELLGSEVPILRLEGRHSEMWDGNVPATCHRMDEVEELNSKGYPAGLALCPTCEYNKAPKCPYMTQFDNLPKYGLIITTTVQAKHIVEKIKPRLWIIDEFTRDALFEKKSIDLNALATVSLKVE